MRLFLAIDLPEKTKRELQKLLDPLQKEYPYFSWVPPINYHITVQFLGECTDKDEVINRIEKSIFETKPFYMYASSTDLFINYKITLFVSFQREKNLEAMVKRLEDEFKIEDGKRYIPHLTFARYKIPSKQQYYLIKKKIENLEIDLQFPVDKIYLYESILTNKIPRYNKIKEFMLIS